MIEQNLNKNELLLTIDVGNTNTKFVFFKQIKNNINPLYKVSVSNKNILYALQNNNTINKNTINNSTIDNNIINNDFININSMNIYFLKNTKNIIISSVNREIKNIIVDFINKINLNEMNINKLNHIKTIFNEKNFNKTNLNKTNLNKTNIKNNKKYTNNFIKIIPFEINPDTPFKFKYKPISSFGKDRLAGLYFSLNSNIPFVVIDIGTAITIDYINSNNEYSGGIIIPSFNLMFKSLYNYTNLLPEIDLNSFDNDKLKKIFSEIGKNINLGFTTRDCMIKGIFSTIIYTLTQYIYIIYKKEKNYLSNKTKLNIVVTGSPKLAPITEEIKKYLSSNFSINDFNINNSNIKNFNIKNNFINIYFEDYLVNKGLKLFFDFHILK